MPSVDSLLKCPQWPGLGRAKILSWELNPDLPCGWQGPSRLSLQRCLLESAVAGSWSQEWNPGSPVQAQVLLLTSISTARPNSHPSGRFFFFKEILNSEKNIISQQKKDLCSQEGCTFSIPTPSLKILTGPWNLESADTRFPWFRPDPGRILKSPRCPLLNHILAIHWGRLCWKKKRNHYPHSPVYFFLDKNLHALHFLRKWFSEWFYILK